MELLSRDDVLSFSKGRVTSPILFLKNGTPDINGVFSEQIFGTTPYDKSHNFGHIELSCKVFSPFALDLFANAYRNDYKIAYSGQPYIIKNYKLEPIPPANISKYKDEDIFYGLYGVINNFYKLKPHSSDIGVTKENFWKIVDKHGIDKIFIDVITVIPINLRPYTNQFQYDEINNVYSSLIKSTQKISEISIRDKQLYAKALNYVQKYVVDIYEILKQKTAKEKRSLLRGNVLGKRVDFSGRTVATVNPDIPPDHVGLPFQMAVKIFEPWVIRSFVSDLNLSIDDAKMLVEKISRNAKLDKELYEKAFDIVSNTCNERSVLVKRDPDLHRGSLKAFKVIIKPEKTLQVNTIINETFGLDYDGDTLAVFTPISQEALQDVEKMHNILHSADPRRFMINFTHDIKGGICLLAMKPDNYKKYDLKKYYWLKKLKYDGEDTTQGRVAIYNMLTYDVKNKIKFKYFNDDRFDIEEIISLLVKNNISSDKILDFANKLQKKATEIITIASESLTLDDFKISDKVEKYRSMIDKEKDINKKQEIINIMEKIVLDELDKTDIGDLIRCGIIKKGQLFQLLGAKGIMLKPDGSLMTVSKNFANGLQPTEYFNASYGARSGIIFRVNKTALTGYLERKLVYGLISVSVDESVDFCGTNKRLVITPDSDLIKRIINRYIVFNGKEYKITLENMNDFVGKEIELYSPIYCKSKGICNKCFGDDYKVINSKNVGVLAAQTLGERLTQNMLKAFHTGGIVKPYYIDFYKNVYENTRIPINEIKNALIEKDHTFYSADNIKLILSKEYYNINSLLKDFTDDINLEFVMFKIELPNGKTFDIVYDGSILLGLPDSYESTETDFILKYASNKRVFSLISQVDNTEIIAKKIINAVEGRVVVKDEYHLLIKLYRLMKNMGQFNFNYLEILVSQLMRDKNNPSIPARLGETWNPQIISIKKIPYVESWIRGIEFENFRKSIENALINPEITMNSKLDELVL